MLPVKPDKLTQILGTPECLLRESERLLRIVSLGPLKPGQKIDDKLEELRQSIACSMGVGSHTDALMCGKVALLTQKQLYQEYKDRFSVFPRRAIQKTRDGENGPTVLVSYQRGVKLADILTNHVGENFPLHKYVFKFSTSRQEVACGEIYQRFFYSLSKEDSEFLGFFVPKATVLDLDCKTYETLDRERCSLSDDICKQIYKNFLQAAATQSIDVPKDRNIIIFLERICGENFFDFVSSKWEDLTLGQKNKFFQRLGRLATLDLVLGNRDRFLRPYLDEKNEFCVNDLEANIGNLMLISPSSGTEVCPILYAIDNEIKDDLIYDVELNAKYLSFLEKLFSSEDFVNSIAVKICDSIKNGLDLRTEDILGKGEKLQDLQARYVVFERDLFEIAGANISKGVLEMCQVLRHNIIPRWDGEEGASLRSYLSRFFPELGLVIQERLKTFKNTKVVC